MRKPSMDDYTVEIIAVSFDEDGNRIERDFNKLPEEEKQRLRLRNTRRALKAAGYVPVGEERAAK